MEYNKVKLEYESETDKKQVYLDDLAKIIIKSGAQLEGNCFYHNKTLKIFPELYTKQLNLFWCGKQLSSHKENTLKSPPLQGDPSDHTGQCVSLICEIGFNAGHSTMLMLLSRDTEQVDFTIFDIGHHPYTRPAFEYIKSKFTHVNFEYIEGDSTITMPIWINDHPNLVHQYDLVHVDGGHSEHCISNDMRNADILVREGGIIIIDDTDSHIINSYVNNYLERGDYTELNVLKTFRCPHRIIRKGGQLSP